MSDTSITVIYHGMSLTVLYEEKGPYQQYFLVFLVAHILPCHSVDCTEIPS